jgi:hypothetical protein
LIRGDGEALLPPMRLRNCLNIPVDGVLESVSDVPLGDSRYGSMPASGVCVTAHLIEGNGVVLTNERVPSTPTNGAP